jgi:hypothetical protein
MPQTHPNSQMILTSAAAYPRIYNVRDVKVSTTSSLRSWA